MTPRRSTALRVELTWALAAACSWESHSACLGVCVPIYNHLPGPSTTPFLPFLMVTQEAPGHFCQTQTPWKRNGTRASSFMTGPTAHNVTLSKTTLSGILLLTGSEWCNDEMRS